MSQWKRISLLIVFTLVFGIIAFFHESRLGKWIDNEVYEFVYSSESFITTSIMLGATKVGEVWAMLCISLLLVAYLMLKRHKIEALFFALTMALSGRVMCSYDFIDFHITCISRCTLSNRYYCRHYWWIILHYFINVIT
ncbi:type 2 phosphatidic acid phosphatase family protein [Staphylococcus aureus]|nr:type 2 phosphatidic acid phosphatase family protein [Staphylococcus aureus]